MLVYTNVFSSFSVNDLEKAKDFYEKALGFPVKQTPEGLSVAVTKDYAVFLYPKPNHEPATFTVLNLQVMSVDAAVDARPALGVQAVPAHPAPEIGRVDGVESLPGVDVDDPLADVEPVVVLLVFLVLVQRLAVSERPLALASVTVG